MRKINTIVYHCSATPEFWREDDGMSHERIFEGQVESIRRYHVDKLNWTAEGYHWFISRRGLILPGRPEEDVGAHVAGHNDDSIGICLIGGGGSCQDDPFLKNFTLDQAAAMDRMNGGFVARFGTGISIKGHHDFGVKKACPGFSVWKFLGGARS